MEVLTDSSHDDNIFQNTFWSTAISLVVKPEIVKSYGISLQLIDPPSSPYLEHPQMFPHINLTPPHQHPPYEKSCI